MRKVSICSTTIVMRSVSVQFYSKTRRVINDVQVSRLADLILQIQINLSIDEKLHYLASINLHAGSSVMEAVLSELPFKKFKMFFYLKGIRRHFQRKSQESRFTQRFLNQICIRCETGSSHTYHITSCCCRSALQQGTYDHSMAKRE